MIYRNDEMAMIARKRPSISGKLLRLKADAYVPLSQSACGFSARTNGLTYVMKQLVLTRYAIDATSN